MRELGGMEETLSNDLVLRGSGDRQACVLVVEDDPALQRMILNYFSENSIHIAVIPITPSGLGVIEITLIAVLKGFGVPGDVAAAGVLSWRLVNFWLPIPFGGASYLSLRFGQASPAAAKARAAKAAKAVTS